MVYNEFCGREGYILEITTKSDATKIGVSLCYESLQTTFIILQKICFLKLFKNKVTRLGFHSQFEVKYVICPVKTSRYWMEKSLQRFQNISLESGRIIDQKNIQKIENRINRITLCVNVKINAPL